LTSVYKKKKKKLILQNDTNTFHLWLHFAQINFLLRF